MISSLVFIVWFLSSIGLLAAIVICVLRKNRQRAMRYAKILSVIVATYFTVLVAVSVPSPRRIVDAKDVWRFDLSFPKTLSGDCINHTDICRMG
jgi:hypothetical protein